MSDSQPNNPLHGLKLEQIVMSLTQFYGWEELGERIEIRCFNVDPSVKSSLKFLRKTPWARTKVEELYLDTDWQAGDGEEEEEEEEEEGEVGIESANEAQAAGSTGDAGEAADVHESAEPGAATEEAAATASDALPPSLDTDVPSEEKLSSSE